MNGYNPNQYPLSPAFYKVINPRELTKTNHSKVQNATAKYNQTPNIMFNVVFF